MSFKLTETALRPQAFLTICKPSVVRFKYNTYITFYGEDYGVRVIKFNNRTLTVEKDTRIASNPIGTDAHGAPAIIVDNDGYIHVFYGSHNSTQYYARSNNPEDVSSFTIKAMALTTPTYPQLAFGYINNVPTIFLAYRKGTTCALVKSQDKGDTWSSEQTIVDFGSGYTIYPWGIVSDMKKPTSTLHMIWHYYDGTNSVRDNVYYAKSVDGGVTWRKADGTQLTLPISRTTADIVFNSTSLPRVQYGSGLYYTATPVDIKLDEDGKPYILFFVPSDWSARIAKYNGGWKTRIVASNLAHGFFPTAFGKVSKNLIQVFALNSEAKIVKYESYDGGETFSLKGTVGNGYYDPSGYPSACYGHLGLSVDLTPEFKGFTPLVAWAGSPLYLYGEEVSPVSEEFYDISWFIMVGSAVMLLWGWLQRYARKVAEEWKALWRR